VALRAVIEDWDDHSSYPPEDTLVLTENPDAIADSSSKVMHHGWAMRELLTGARA